MVSQTKTLRVPAGSEIADLLARAADTPIVLETDGERFRVIREDENIWAGYDPAQMRAALKYSAGALAGVDVDALKAELRAQRDQDSIGRPA
ncbi:MAG: hypothetical protein ACRDJW_19675 [Thermomicrobiales bacterium]